MTTGRTSALAHGVFRVRCWTGHASSKFGQATRFCHESDLQSVKLSTWTASAFLSAATNTLAPSSTRAMYDCDKFRRGRSLLRIVEEGGLRATAKERSPSQLKPPLFTRQSQNREPVPLFRRLKNGQISPSAVKMALSLRQMWNSKSATTLSMLRLRSNGKSCALSVSGLRGCDESLLRQDRPLDQMHISTAKASSVLACVYQPEQHPKANPGPLEVV